MARAAKTPVQTGGEVLYMVKNADGDGCESHAPFLGYKISTLKSLASAGYKLYINGKSTKLPTEAEWMAAQNEVKGKRNGSAKE